MHFVFTLGATLRGPLGVRVLWKIITRIDLPVCRFLIIHDALLSHGVQSGPPS